MVYAERGIGKTWVGLNIAHAVGGGGVFLRWLASTPRRVVYIDGEMPASALKDRYAAIVATADFDAPESAVIGPMPGAFMNQASCRTGFRVKCRDRGRQQPPARALFARHLQL